MATRSKKWRYDSFAALPRRTEPIEEEGTRNLNDEGFLPEELELHYLLEVTGDTTRSERPDQLSLLHEATDDGRLSDEDILELLEAPGCSERWVHDAIDGEDFGAN